MKEIVITRVDTRVCDNCPLSDDLDADCYMRTEKRLECQIETNKYITRQIPETWEELILLCKKLVGKTGTENIYICERNENIQVCDILFTKHHTVEFDMDTVFSTNMSYENMWNMIKCLLEEKDDN